MDANLDIQSDSDETATLDLEKKELAEERTDWAVERTALANERTLASWIRTGLAAIATGLGIARFFADSPTVSVLARIIAGILILAGAGAYVVGLWRYAVSFEDISEEDPEVTPLWVLNVVVASLVLCGFLALGLVVAF